MSDLSKKTLIPSGDTKNYIENYWTKRADAFAALRRQELHSEKYSQWQREIVQHLPPAKQLRILDVGCRYCQKSDVEPAPSRNSLCRMAPCAGSERYPAEL